MSAPVDAHEDLGELALVELAQVRDSGLNPRTHLDAEALEELARSIAEEGIRDPLLVREHPTEPGSYQVADGHRRLRAAEWAKCITIPVRILPMDDAAFRRRVALANLGRENLTPLEEAQAFASLLDGNGGGPVCTVPELAARAGKTETFVYQRLKLRELRPDVAELLTDGTLPLAHALLVARVPVDRQRATVLGGVFGLGPMQIKDDDGKRALRKMIPPAWGADRLRPAGTLAELRGWIEQEIHLNLKTAPFPPVDAELLPAVGSCITCPKRTGFQPALFPELAAGRDECTDRACFAAKTDAHVKRTIAEHRAQGVKLAKITANDVRRTADAKKGEWTKAAAGTKGAVQAIHVADAKAGAVEWVTLKRAPAKRQPATAADADGTAAPAAKAKQEKPWEDEVLVDDCVRDELIPQQITPALLKEIQGCAMPGLSDAFAVAVGRALGMELENEGLARLEGKRVYEAIDAPSMVFDGVWYDQLRKSLPGKFTSWGRPEDLAACQAVCAFARWLVEKTPARTKTLRAEAIALLKAAEEPEPAPPPKAAKGRPVKKAAKR